MRRVGALLRARASEPQVIVDRRATVAGEFAFKIYRKHRFPPKSNMNKVILRSGKRDQVPWLVIMLVATFAMLVFVLLRWLLTTPPDASLV